MNTFIYKKRLQVLEAIYMQFTYFYQWSELPQSASKLFAQSEKDSLFFSRLWFENLSNTALEPKQSLLLACVVDAHNVLAILPLIKNDKQEWTSLSHIYTSLYTVLLVENNKHKILQCLAQGLSQCSFHTLKLGPISADDSTIDLFEAALQASGLSCNRYAQFFNWFQVTKNLTFEKYMQARPSKVINTITRKKRKLEREQIYDIQSFRKNEVAQKMADFDTVYEASWKPDERFKETMYGFIKCFSKQDWTRLAILYIDKKPVAAQIWFVVHNKASIFKLAYDETWKQYSPGSILTQYLMEYVIDVDKVTEIDFLTGNDRYKQDWMSERRQRWNLVCTQKVPEVKSVNPIIQFIRNLK